MIIMCDINHQKEELQDERKEITASNQSLSKYETNLKSALPQIISTVLAATYHIQLGLSLGYSAILIPQVEDPTSDVQVTKSESSWIASIVTIAIPVGSFFSGFLMDYVGRLRTIQIAAIPGVVGWVAVATAENFPVILLGRILTGLSCGMGTCPGIVYITEVARPDLRGSLNSVGPTLAALGTVIAYTTGAFMTWRIVAWINIIFALVPALLVYILVPESPVWLVSKGKIEEAAKSLKFLYKKYPQINETGQPVYRMHLNNIIKEKEQKLLENVENSTLKEFLKPTGYKPLIVLFWLFLVQEFSGIYITLFFAVSFIQEFGTEINAYHASIFIGLIRFVMSLFNVWLLKRFCRRPLIMVSSIGMAVFMTISGFFTLWIKEGTSTMYWVPIACLLMYVFSSLFGILNIPWTMSAELFPNHIRGVGHSIVNAGANFLIFLSLQSYRVLTDVLGGAHGVQWFFAVVSVLGFIFGLVYLPETHGKKLSEIEDYFNRKSKKKEKSVDLAEIQVALKDREKV